MASETDICNLACSNIGEEANVQSISPPDSTVAAEKCAQFYPMARDELLETHAWTFNTAYANLTQAGTNPLVGTWSYAYALPTACIRALAVYLPGAVDGADSEDFMVAVQDNGDPVLYTNAAQAVLKYSIRVLATGRFSPTFNIALARRLSIFLAGALIKGKASAAVIASQTQLFLMEFTTAKATNAAQQQSVKAAERRRPPHMTARF